MLYVLCGFAGTLFLFIISFIPESWLRNSQSLQYYQSLKQTEKEYGEACFGS